MLNGPGSPEERLREATARLNSVPQRRRDHGLSGSDELAVWINEEELSARSAQLRALEEMRDNGSPIADLSTILAAIDRTKAEILTNKNNLSNYR